MNIHYIKKSLELSKLSVSFLLNICSQILYMPTQSTSKFIGTYFQVSVFRIPD